MYITKLQENIKTILDKKNTSLLDYQTLVTKLHNIKNTDLFLFSYLRDTINLFSKVIKNSHNDSDLISRSNKINRLLNVIIQRLIHFHHWEGNNTTISMIRNREIPHNKIKPFVRKSNRDYENYYASQNEVLKKRLRKKINDVSSEPNKHLNKVSIELKKSLAHSYRKTYVVHLVEFLMGLVDKTDKELDEKTWLDIGCSIGVISNAVDSSLYAQSHWKIMGCDLQKNRIKYAQHLSAKNRDYFSDNAFKLIRNMNKNNKSIDIVSMFEFCEHFEDPVKLIHQAANLNIKIIVIATPLNQKINAPFNDEQDNVHLWGFSRASMEAIVNSTNMEIFSITENRIGTYNHGFDWITTVMVNTEFKKKIHNAFDKK